MYMIKRMTAADLRKNLFSALDEVEKGNTVIITRHGKSVASLFAAKAIDVRPGLDRAALLRFCEKYRIRELSLFGSVLRPEFNPASDIDVLFDPEQGKSYSHREYLDMETELEVIFARKVDLVNRRVLLRHENHLRRDEILTTAQPIVTRKAKAA